MKLSTLPICNLKRKNHSQNYWSITLLPCMFQKARQPTNVRLHNNFLKEKDQDG